MVSMRWRLIHASTALPTDSLMIPRARFGHTLTRISKSAAILFGGQDAGCLSDCWILNLDSAMDLQNGSPIWKKITQQNCLCSHIAHHCAVLEPTSSRLWLIGGIFSARKLQKISLNVLPLKVLATEFAARLFEKGDSRLESDELPKELKRELVANWYIMADH